MLLLKSYKGGRQFTGERKSGRLNVKKYLIKHAQVSTKLGNDIQWLSFVSVEESSSHGCDSHIFILIMREIVSVKRGRAQNFLWR